jgi:hypothetical protein
MAVTIDGRKSVAYVPRQPFVTIGGFE